MLNAEKYRKEVLKLAEQDDVMALVNGKPVSCNANDRCVGCDFYSNNSDVICEVERAEWLLSEYKEPQVDWSTVAVDTPIWVSSDGKKWLRRHFADYHNGMVCAWDAGCTSWSVETEACTWQYAKLADMESDTE